MTIAMTTINSVRGTSKLGCEIALGALRAAGGYGLRLPLLLRIVCEVGNCSEDAAYQQLRIYVRPHVQISSFGDRMEEAPRGRGYKIESQFWSIPRGGAS